ncbi:MAG: helix-turn-helix domain-containing protein [Marinobacter sp.]|uniref:Crp/Fnr family transcriptional regulator n=1 Tax=Marinobacter sp. TaxID=50741 RepID=UPI00299CF54B|nr:helix-turn-helix domain-containing protein [Marinobacter sp.]MDX1754616.1 helix-turn-helix domain-containing protein [Marinobacter sp.]
MDRHLHNNSPCSRSDTQGISLNQASGTPLEHNHCRFCRAKPYCLPGQCHLDQSLLNLARLVQRHRVLHAHQHLFRQHERADFLMVLSSGVCKSYFLDGKIREHVCAFFYPGDLIGIDSLDHESYQANAVMLETGCVCFLPIASIHQALTTSPELQQQMIRMLSRQLWHEYARAGSFTAEERVVQFLLELSHKQKRLGYSASELRLFMGRSDIASYLGLRAETVSRTLTRLQKDNLIRVHRETVCLCDVDRLRTLSALSE